MGKVTKKIRPNFGRDHVIFLLENLETLGQGLSPDDNWCNQPTRGKEHIFQAPFIVPIELHAEITQRLEACGLDGELLRRYHADGYNDAELLGRLYGMPVVEILFRLNAALKYISGWDRKTIAYATWKETGRSQW